MYRADSNEYKDITPLIPPHSDLLPFISTLLHTWIVDIDADPLRVKYSMIHLVQNVDTMCNPPMRCSLAERK